MTDRVRIRNCAAHRRRAVAAAAAAAETRRPPRHGLSRTACRAHRRREWPNTARRTSGPGMTASYLSRSGKAGKRPGEASLPAPGAHVIRAPLMFAFIVTIHVVVSVFLIFVILLQPGKGDAMAAFAGGGGSANTVFGGRGSVTFLSKVTTVCAIIFMVTSLTLAWRSSHSDSVLRARRNIAAQDAAKKKSDDKGSTQPKVPTGQTAPAPATGGAAIPAQNTQMPPANPPAAPSKKQP